MSIVLPLTVLPLVTRLSRFATEIVPMMSIVLPAPIVIVPWFDQVLV